MVDAPRKISEAIQFSFWRLPLSSGECHGTDLAKEGMGARQNRFALPIDEAERVALENRHACNSRSGAWRRFAGWLSASQIVHGTGFAGEERQGCGGEERGQGQPAGK